MSTQNADALAELVAGFSETPKRIPSKYLYDSEGSRIFEAITSTPEYYLTRTELRLLGGNARAIGQAMKDVALLLEFGAGSAQKASLLLPHLRSLAAYVPIDVSLSALNGIASEITKSHPEITILPIRGDYSARLPIPPIGDFGCTGGLFLGSTIGNMERSEIRSFVGLWRDLAGRGALGLIGVDLFKPLETLEAAYNDREGVTASFNLNLLAHLNREIGSDFEAANFRHRAVFNSEKSRIEMHLVSTREQVVSFGGRDFRLEEGEHLHTESCYKYRFNDFLELIGTCGSRPIDAWVDPEFPYALVLVEL